MCSFMTAAVAMTYVWNIPERRPSVLSATTLFLADDWEAYALATPSTRYKAVSREDGQEMFSNEYSHSMLIKPFSWLGIFHSVLFEMLW